MLMKKQITFAVTLLLIVVAAAGCQKDEETSLKKDLTGKWLVAKIETTIQGSATVTYTGVSSDYFEFRNNEEDEVVINLNASNYIGNYVVLDGDLLNVSYNGKLRTTKVTTISATKLEFSGTVEGSSPAVTEKYYLTR
jgi:hypothetical protein